MTSEEDSTERTAARRARFRESLRRVAAESTSDDLIRWVLVPASIAVILGFNLMLFAWIGASRTHREIEQIPYLISGGLVGLAFVFLGSLMLASVFWVVLLRKLHDEAEARAEERSRTVEAKLDAFEARMPSNGASRARSKSPRVTP